MTQMIADLFPIFTAVIPIFLLIAAGFGLRKYAGFADDFWRQVEKITFNGLFPALLFVKIAEAQIDWETALPITITVIAGIFAAAIAAVPFRYLLKMDLPPFVSVFHGGFRPNSYIGIAIVIGIFGDPATGPMAITLFVVSLTINILGVWGHLWWLPPEDGRTGLLGVFIDSAKNPLILGCILGGIFNAIGWGLPPIIGPTLDLVSRAALPMGLMAVGAGLSIRAATQSGAPVAATCFCKLLLLPLVTYGVGLLVGLQGFALIIPTLFAALPTSSTAYVVSRRMGSDATLIASIITVTHLIAILTLPVALSLLK